MAIIFRFIQNRHQIRQVLDKDRESCEGVTLVFPVVEPPLTSVPVYYSSSMTELFRREIGFAKARGREEGRG
jgi:hypothetical protein